VARAIEAVMPAVEAAGHTVHVGVPQGLVVDGDPLRLTQVLSNLLTNAAKYTLRGGRIEVTVEARGAAATVLVADNGTGLSADLLPRVFDLFVQGRRNLGRSEGGLGIGLALVKQLVLAHGGTVAAFSDGPGQGSEFLVTLPLAAGPVDGMSAADAEAMEELTAMGSGVNVLVVDDNSDAADLAATVLTDAGHRVEVAYSGLEALERVAGWHPDVVVLDIGLPDLDGYQIAAELRSRHPERVFQMIALTGYGQPHDRTRSAAAGFAAHLVKPVDPVQLSAAVGRLAGAADVEARPPV
jgi:CheY-like chemotaxis protein